MVPLKYFSNFWKTIEMALFNCEIYLILTWYENSFIIADVVDGQVPRFALTEEKALCYSCKFINSR